MTDIKESNNKYKNQSTMEKRATLQRCFMSKMERNELEDIYLRTHDENIILKKHGRKQEEKIKRMATKLLRLFNDKKKLEVNGKPDSGSNIQAEDKIIELEEKLHSMEKSNMHLKDKLLLAKQQSQTGSAVVRRPAPFPHVRSRINTGIPKTQTLLVDPRISKNVRVVGPAPQPTNRAISPQLQPRYGQSVLEETRAERKILEENVAKLNEQLNLYESEISQLQEQAKLRDADFDEELRKLKLQATSGQRLAVQENIDMIRLQRDVKEKSCRLLALQEKFSVIESNSRTLRSSYDQIVMEMDHVNIQLKAEQNRVLSLQNQLRMGEANQRRMVEMKEQIIDLQRETDTLKEANENLVGSAFDLERERNWRQRENKLKVQIAQLEATMKSDLGEKGSIIDRYASERDANEKLQQEYRELQVRHFEMKQQFDDLNDKFQFFTQGNALNMADLEDALVLVKQKKQEALPDVSFVQKVDDEIDKDCRQRFMELQAEYAETIHELEKTRNMLIVQHKINKDYQKETELTNRHLQEVKQEYEFKLDEYAGLLDIRAARIKKLESQLRDVAYGTRQSRLPLPDDMDTIEDLEETIHLERGQNVLEIHIQKRSCTVELHQSFGQDYRTIAACQVVFRDLFDKPGGRVHGTATLTGLAENETGVSFGTVGYWIRLRVPMDQALRLYKERTKALGYLTANEQQTNVAVPTSDSLSTGRPMNNVNELHIKITRASKLKARRTDVQPSPYCVYQFYDFCDHDTVIVRNSNNPEFHDHKTYPVAMTPHLDQYLRVTQLSIFVFDDADPVESAFLGKSDVPLMTLISEQRLNGTFPLTRSTDDRSDCSLPDKNLAAGTVDVELFWQSAYIRPSLTPSKPIPLKMEPAPQEKPERDRATPVRERPGKSQPVAQSTPMPVASSAACPTGRQMKAIPEDKSYPKPVVVKHLPKPTARRRIHMPGEKGVLDDEVVESAVSSTVSNYLPLSQIGWKDIDDISTIQEEKDNPSESNHKSVDAGDTEPNSTEEEEILPRPAPPRSSLNIESDLSSEEEKVIRPRTQRRIFSNKSRTAPEEQLHDDKKIEEHIPKSSEVECQPIGLDENNSNHVVLSSASSMAANAPPPKESVANVLDAEDSDPAPVESDSEGVMMVSPAVRKARAPKSSDLVTVVVSTLSLESESSIMQNPEIRKLFVEYHFLGLPPEETETPDALLKPRPYQSIAYHFSKTIAVDMEKNYDRRQRLAAMLLPDDPDRGRIKFTIVSEPDTDDEDCEDVGVAYASVRDILKHQEDIKNHDLDVLDPKDEHIIIGQLNVSVECLETLQAVDQEMQIDGTY